MGSSDYAGRFVFTRSSVMVFASLLLALTALSAGAAGIDVGEKGSKKANLSPVLDSIGSRFTREDQRLRFIVKAADEKGVPTLTAEGLPEGASFSDNHDGTGVFDWKPEWSLTSENTGSFVVTFLATDDEGEVTSEKVTITVGKAHSRGWEFIILGGFSAPRGTFSRYADGGLGITVRATYHPRPVRAVGFWSDLNYIWFGSDRLTVEFDEAGYEPTADQKVTEQAISFHVGAQLGSKSGRAFFRPRAAIGPGLYIFYTTSAITAEDAFGDEEEFNQLEETFVRFGWRIILGADLYTKSRFAIAVELVYDHVHRLDQPEGFDSSSRTTRFTGVFGGVTLSY